MGGIGVSGDTSCADHLVSWRVRMALGYDANTWPLGVGGLANSSDAMIYDRRTATVAESASALASESGFGHPVCSAQSRIIGKQIHAAYDAAF
jgi:hypothetical protein